MEQFTLIMIRHAEAEPLANSDHARNLTTEGRARAETIGAELAKTISHCDLAIVSSAARARQTFEELGKNLLITENKAVPDLYSANSEFEFSNILKTHATKEAHVIIVVGHNPVISVAATVYTGERVEFAPAVFLVLKQEAASWELALESDGCWEIARLHT